MKYFTNLIQHTLIITLSMLLTSCNAQNEKPAANQAAKAPAIKRVTNMQATSMAAMAAQRLMDVADIQKYSTTSGSQNYQQPDEYYSIDFQINAKPHILAHTMIDGTLLYLQKLIPAEQKQSTELNEDSAATLGYEFVNNRFTYPKDRFQVTKAELEKVAKGVDAYWIVTLDNTNPSEVKGKVPKSIVLKFHSKTHEVMVIDLTY